MSCSVLKTYKNASKCELSENANPHGRVYKWQILLPQQANPATIFILFSFLDLEIERTCRCGIPIDDYNLERSIVPC